jgi:proteasome lid subunit RPN8/RPN11
MLRDHYQYALELERLDGSPLGQFPVVLDWEPAREWARFMSLREDAGESKQPAGDAMVEPDWDASRGEPFVGGVRVCFAGNGTAPRPVTLPLTYFRKAATEVSRGLVEKKILQSGEQFHYSVVAFRTPNSARPKPALNLTIEEVVSRLPVKARSSRDLFECATAFGAEDADDIPVFIPQPVLDAAAAVTRAAEAAETAGVLIGHVCRDPESHKMFLETTDLIPAKHTRSESTQVTFTPETWTAVESAIHLRHDGELMLGWFHSHPAKFWCSAKCSPETRRQCPLARSFFSGEDCTLHRTVFPMGHCIALVVTNTDAGLRYALFGWRHGLIVQRGFHVLNASPGMAESAEREAVIGEKHEEICT